MTEEPVEVCCPWCGEWMTTFVDLSVASQNYVEDCQVCCRPMQLSVQADPLAVHAERS